MSLSRAVLLTHASQRALTAVAISQPLNRLRELGLVFRGKEGRSRHECIRASPTAFGGCFHVDAAVDFEPKTQTARLAKRVDLDELWEHVRAEGLPAETGLHRHH